MSRHSQRTLGPMELDRVQSGPCSGLKSLQDWKALVGRAFGRAGLSHKVAAADLGITPQQLSNQLSLQGKEHLSFWRMHGLSRDCWRELVLLVIEFYALDIGVSERDRADLEVGRSLRELVTRVSGR